MFFEDYYKSVVMHLLNTIIKDGSYSTSATMTAQENRLFCLYRLADYIVICLI